MRIDARRNKKGAVLSTVATVVFLITFTVTLIFLTVYIGIQMAKGTAGGTASLTAEIKSEYSDERTLLYLTDEYGNKLTDLIGQAVLYPAASEIVVPADITTKPTVPLQIDNSQYQCSTGGVLVGGTYDNVYKVTRVNLNRYLRCYVIPNKLGKMYSNDTYCLFAAYDKDGPDKKNATFGNDKLSPLPGCGGGKLVSADIAPPPGYAKPITLRLEKV